MTTKKASLTMILIYIAIFFAPLLMIGASANQAILFTTVLYFLGAISMIFIYLKQTEDSLVQQQAQLPAKRYIFILGISGIFLAMIIQSIVFSIEMALTGESPSSENTQSIVTIILSSPIFILATTIGGPIMEEFVFRRSLIALAQPISNFWLAAIISSAIFSLAHNDGHFFVYFFMGFFFAYLYKVTGSIWTSIIAHCGMNTIVILTQLAIHFGKISVS